MKYEVWFRGVLEYEGDKLAVCYRLLKYFGGRSCIVYTETGIKEYCS